MKTRTVQRGLLAGLSVAVVGALVGVSTTAFADVSGPVTPGPTTHRPAPKGAQLGAKQKKTVKPDSYIVTLKDKKASQAQVHSASTALASSLGGKVEHEYSHALRGFSVHMSAAQAARMKADSRVASVVPDSWVGALDTQTSPPSWGLDRIDQTYLPLNNSYSSPSNGSGVHVYVLDEGIRITNTDFGGRAEYGYDFIDNDAVADDPTADDPACASVPAADRFTGHGTHVAGIIGGTTYGVAKGADLVAVRVLGCDGSAEASTIVAGIDWVTANAVKPAVVNMSLGGPASGNASIDAAVANSIASGITYTVAAGNDYDDACMTSPADVPGAITVGASASTDFRADFSNFGRCVDVFAPGESITSTYNTSDTATTVMGGTSMAAPHVAGAAALLLAADPTLTPAQISDEITSSSVKMELHNVGEGSPNRLLNVNGTSTSTTISLRAEINGGYVSASNTGKTALIANRLLPFSWETFDVVPAPSAGYIALKAHSNGKYVTAENGGKSPLVANRTAVGNWESFKIVTRSDGSINLLAKANGKYVTAENAGRSSLIANRSSAGAWETFDETGPAATIHIKAGINGKYVTAENAGKSALIANRPAAGAWETFDVADLGDGWVALFAHADNKYVTAENAGKSPLIANRPAVGDWEAFYFLSYDGDASVIFANADGMFVTAANAGKSPLIANRFDVGSWEQFYIS